VILPLMMMRQPDQQRPDLSSGLPSTVHSPYTVEGEIEQAGKIAAGLRVRRRGWQRVVVLAGAAMVVVALVVALVVFVVDLVSR
jgi:hypothetical protein